MSRTIVCRTPRLGTLFAYVLSLLRPRSARSSTFGASLELTKQGEVVLGQGGDFQPIHVGPASSGQAACAK